MNIHDWTRNAFPFYEGMRLDLSNGPDQQNVFLAITTIETLPNGREIYDDYLTHTLIILKTSLKSILMGSSLWASEISLNLLSKIQF